MAPEATVAQANLPIMGPMILDMAQLAAASQDEYVLTVKTVTFLQSVACNPSVQAYDSIYPPRTWLF